MIGSALKKMVLSALTATIIFSSNVLSQSKDKNEANSLAAVSKPATEPKAEEILKLIPAESLFVVRVNKFENTLDKVDEFLLGISPMPMATRLMVQMQLAKALGSGQLSGLNMNGDFAAFGIVSEDQNVAPGLLVPVTDYQQFVSDNNSFSKPDDKGISKITIKGTDVGFSKKVGNYALICQRSENFAKIADATKKAGMDTVLEAGQKQEAVSSPIWAFGNMEKVHKTFGGKIDAQFEMMKSMMGQCSQQEANAQQIMNLYFDAAKKLMSQTKSVTMKINLKSDILTVSQTVVAVPGTEMAKALTAAPTVENKTAFGYLKNGALINTICREGSPLFKEMNNYVLEFVTGAENEKKAGDKEKWKQLFDDIESNVGAVSSSSWIDSKKNKSPFEGEYVIEIKDAKKFRNTINQAIELTNSSWLIDFYKQLGIKLDISIKHDVDSYKGMAIDSIKMNFKMTDANSPQAGMIENMYGKDGLDYRIVMLDNLCVLSLSSDPNSIHKLIDEVKSGKAKEAQSEIKAAMAMIPGSQKADVFGTVNVLRYFEIIKSMMPIMPGLPQINIPQSSSNIAFAAKAENGRLTLDIAMPKQHLSEIVGMTMMIQEQVMQQMQMQEPGQEKQQWQMEPEPKKVLPRNIKPEEKKF